MLQAFSLPRFTIVKSALTGAMLSVLALANLVGEVSATVWANLSPHHFYALLPKPPSSEAVFVEWHAAQRDCQLLFESQNLTLQPLWGTM
jgi:hypothetical protein